MENQEFPLDSIQSSRANDKHDIQLTEDQSKLWHPVQIAVIRERELVFHDLPERILQAKRKYL